MSGSLSDDVKAFLASLGQLAQSVDAVSSSATAAVEKLKAVPDRLGESFDRVMEAGVTAAIGAGAQALDAELKRPFNPSAASAAPHATAPAQASPGGPWTPATGCIHDRTCTSPNPWRCHHDEARPAPGGQRGPKGETHQWYCTCAPCHAPYERAHPAPAPEVPRAPKAAAPPVPVPQPASANENVIPELGTRSTSCDKHGHLAWNGHLICGNCRRVYQGTDPKGERYAPDVCVCSSNLRPQKREPFAGRPLCQLCFLANVKSGRMA